MSEPRIGTTQERRPHRLATEVWGGAFMLGLLIAVLGVFALSSTVATGLLSVIFLGAVIAVSGVVEGVYGIQNRNMPHVLGSVLAVVVGGLLLFQTAVGLAAVTFLLAGYLFTNGLFHTVTSLMNRRPSWGWDFVYGLISLALGIGVMLNWPLSSLRLVGTFVGLEILFRGVALMMDGVAVRRISRHAHAP
jgi:uncharacterized membrane protein HdeD (DUF308 family)